MKVGLLPKLQLTVFFSLYRSEEMEITFPVYEKDTDHDYHTIDGLGFLTNDVVGESTAPVLI